MGEILSLFDDNNEKIRRKKSCLEIDVSSKEDILVYENQFISAILRNETPANLRTLIEKIISFVFLLIIINIIIIIIIARR